MSNLEIDLGSENPDAVAFQHDPLATSQADMPSGAEFEREEERGEAIEDSVKTDGSGTDEEYVCIHVLMCTLLINTLTCLALMYQTSH